MRHLLPFALATTLLSCGAGGPAAPLAVPPTYQPKGQSKCSISKSKGRPLVVEWPSADRAALEALAKRGLVAVRYEGCEMELLAQCSVPGIYGYTPTTIKRDRITIRDADELYAHVPLGAAKLEGKLAKAGELNVSMTIVGRYDSDRTVVAGSDLEGMCGKATHVITGLTIGAFEFFAGADATVGVGAEVVVAGAGAQSTAQRETLNQDGDPEACGAASVEDAQPPDGCGATLRVEVVPLTGAPAPAPAPVAAGGDGTAAGGTAPAAGQPIAAAAGAVVTAGPGVVKVHIDSPLAGVQLRGADVATLEPVGDQFRSLGVRTIICTAPCDTWVDARVGQSMHLVSPEMPMSTPFSLFEHEGEVTLDVEPGTTGLATTGSLLAVLGALGITPGIVMLIIGAGGDDPSDDDLLLAGAITTAGSAAFLTSGILMMTFGSTD
ncbi:MAG: hypothetical protein JRI68_22680, partial [Deltaproteobacteria bacterium]|nr:hypothetical protein [Deltaproteobacteria bacterium]